MLNRNFAGIVKYVCPLLLLCLAFVMACSEKSSEESPAEQPEKTTTAVSEGDSAAQESPEAGAEPGAAEEPEAMEVQQAAQEPQSAEGAERETESQTPAAPASEPDQTGLVSLDITLPKPMFVGTPQNFRVAKLEKPLGRPRPPFLAPAGTKNVAYQKPVSSTDEAPIIGETAMITDGDKEGGEGSYVELGPFLQHATLDLGAKHTIYAILFWHYHGQARVYFDVIVQVADDPDFTANVRTLFNNDHDNSAGVGVGEDLHYVETSEGKLVDARGVEGRYVRLYSKGNTNNDLNHYIEVEVYGKPVPTM